MELNQKIIDASYKLMETLTKGYLWYIDSPEQPFKYTTGSIWLINPETEKWVLELKNSGELWYYYKIHNTFSRYLNMEESDFQSFIKLWVEDVLKNGVVPILDLRPERLSEVEDVLKKGVVPTINVVAVGAGLEGDVYKKGVFPTMVMDLERQIEMKNILKNGKQWN